MSDIQNVVILSACRTAVGRFGGSLKSVSTDDLGSHEIVDIVYCTYQHDLGQAVSTSA